MSTITIPAWVALDASAGDGNLQFQEVTSKQWDDDNIDVKVMYCGVCGTDVSAISGELGPMNPPKVCGHEIVGEVIKVGSAASKFKEGDMVVIGPQCDSCRVCDWCEAGEEQFCPQMCWTYLSPLCVGASKGMINQGGYAKLWRGSARFANKVPVGMDPADAAALVCTGITVYSPLKRFGAGTSAKRVGIIGLGGVGHAGVMFASAMGADVTVISRGDRKKDDALKLGAKRYIPTGSDLGKDFEGHERSLDLIICTINPETLPISDYMRLLRPMGTIVVVGIVPNPLAVESRPLIWSGAAVAGSPIGSPAEIKEMLDLAVEKNIKPWTQKYNMDNVNKAIRDMKAGKARYRFVLVNTDNGGVM